MKCKGKIVFSGELFKLDLQSEEKVNAAPNLLSEKVIDVIKFTKEEVLSGKSRDIDHIDYISLSLSSIPGYTFENSLSSGADFTISYDNISDFDTFMCKYENGCLHLTGELKFQLNVKNIVYNDFKNSGLILFSQIGLRVGGTEIVRFTKYGSDWMLEKEQRKLYSDTLDDVYVTGRPTVELE